MRLRLNLKKIDNRVFGRPRIIDHSAGFMKEIDETEQIIFKRLYCAYLDDIEYQKQTTEELQIAAGASEAV